MKFLTSFLAAASIVAAGLYPSSSPVKHLDYAQYEKLKKTGTPVLVEFYSNTCPHCKNMVSEYEKVATMLKGVVRVYATDDDTLMSLEQINRVPSFKFYSDNNVEAFTQPPTADSLVDFAMTQLRSTVRARQGKKTTTKKSKSTESGKSTESSKSTESATKDGDVIKLTESSFNEMMKDTENAYFIKMFAPWCGHCKAIEGTWKQLASELQGKVKVAEVDATVETSLAQRLEVRGYPTLLFFPAGKKSYTRFKQYNGPRELQEMIQFAMKEASVSLKPSQLIGQVQFDTECESKTCVLAILPHILDSSASERKKYIRILTEIMIEEAGLPVKYFWMEGSNNIAFERELHLEFGWPAVVALNRPKGVYSIHRGGFNKSAIVDFIRGMTSGRTSADPLPAKLPTLSKMIKWDGKDAKEEL